MENIFNVKKKLNNNLGLYQNETCSVQENTLGSAVTSTGKLLETGQHTGAGKIIIGTDTIEVDSESKTVNYYVVVEFVNQESAQNDDMTKNLEGTVSVELAA